MSRRFHLFFNLSGILLALILTGCNQASRLEEMTPPEDQATAKHYIELLRQRQFDQIKDHLSPSLETSLTDETLAQMAAQFPQQEPITTKIVGVNFIHTPDVDSSNISLEYEFPDKWLLANVATQKRDGVTAITGFHIYPTPDSLENLNKFTFRGKNSTQYLTLFLVVVDLLFTLYALVVCIRTRIVKRKWLWIIFTLFGVGRLGVNWTSGENILNFAWIGFPTVQAFSPLFGPWIISISLPIGAIVSLALRDKLGASADQIANSYPLSNPPADPTSSPVDHSSPD